MSKEKLLHYNAGPHECQGSFFQAENSELAPTILVGHTWKGKSDFEIENNKDPFFNINTEEDLEIAKKLLENDKL